MGASVLPRGDEGRTVGLAEFQRRVREFVDGAAEGPLTLTRNGQPVVVVLDFEAYRGLAELEERAEDLYWSVVALRRMEEWRQNGRHTVSVEEAEVRAQSKD